jgi:hypothetical protein
MLNILRCEPISVNLYWTSIEDLYQSTYLQIAKIKSSHFYNTNNRHKDDRSYSDVFYDYSATIKKKNGVTD